MRSWLPHLQLRLSELLVQATTDMPTLLHPIGFYKMITVAASPRSRKSLGLELRLRARSLTNTASAFLDHVFTVTSLQLRHDRVHTPL